MASRTGMAPTLGLVGTNMMAPGIKIIDTE